MAPFSIQGTEFSLELSGQVVEISPTRNSAGISLFYRNIQDSQWTLVLLPYAATKAQFAVPCGEQAQTFQFLMTSDNGLGQVEAMIQLLRPNNPASTSQDDASRKLNMRQQCSSSGNETTTGSGNSTSMPTRNSTCVERGVAIYSYLLGNWEMDLTTLASFMRQNLSASGETVTVTGSGTFGVSSPNTANFTYSDLTIARKIDVAGFSVPTTTTVNSDAGGQLFMQATGQLCLGLGNSTGEVDINTSLGDTSVSLGQEFLSTIGIWYFCMRPVAHGGV